MKQIPSSTPFAAMLVLGVCLILFPSAALAQGTIAGQVTDSSSAILPGVTVEAISPALIEGARATVTDGQGRYQITDLRPGTYKVTFTVAGTYKYICLIHPDMEGTVTVGE